MPSSFASSFISFRRTKKATDDKAGRGKNKIVDSFLILFIIFWIIAVYILRLMCTFVPQEFEQNGTDFVTGNIAFLK